MSTIILFAEFNYAERNAMLVPENETVNGSPSKFYNAPKSYYLVSGTAFMSIMKVLRV